MDKITVRNQEFLSELVSRLAFRDFKAMNPNPKMYANGKTNYQPYSLSPDTNEAREMLNIAYKSEPTPEEVEIVKAYILKAKILRNELRYK